MPRSRRRDEPEIRPMTLGSALRASVRLIAWCKACRHQVEPEVAAQVDRYGPELTPIEWQQRAPVAAAGKWIFVVSGSR